MSNNDNDNDNDNDIAIDSDGDDYEQSDSDGYVQSEMSDNESISLSPLPSEASRADVCVVCKKGLKALCDTCQGDFANPDGEVPICDVVTARCNHKFHFHCLSRALRSQTKCPVDGGEFEFKRFGDPM